MTARLLLPLMLLAAACGPRVAERPIDKAPPPPPAVSSAASHAPPECASPLTGPAPAAAWFALGDSAPPDFPAHRVDPSVVTSSLGQLGGEPVAVTDAHGALLVAWGDAKEVRVRKLEGDQWKDLPSIPASLVAPLLILDKEGRPVIAFQEGDRVRVYRFTGEKFEDLSPRTRPPARRFDGATLSGPITCLESIQPIPPTAFTLDAEGHPVLAWAEPAGRTMRLIVVRHDGHAWQTASLFGVAPVDFCEPNALTVTLVPGGLSQPVATIPTNEGPRLFLWKSGALAELPRIPREKITPPFSWALVTVDDSGRPWIAQTMRGEAKSLRLSVLRLDKTGWRTLPVPMLRAGATDVLPLSFAGGRAPSLVLLDQGEGGARVRVVQWTEDQPIDRAGGPEGVNLQGVIPPVRPSVILSPEGSPFGLLYRPGAWIGVRRWVDGAFRVPGAPRSDPSHLGEGAPNTAPSVAMRGQQVAVAFALGQGVDVRQYADCQWNKLPEAAPPDRRPLQPPHVTLDGQGRAVVAWSTHTNTAIAARRFEGGAWQDLGVSRPNTGPSGGQARIATVIELLTDAADAPVLAWSDGQSGFFQVTRWDGAAWRPLLEDQHADVVVPPAMAVDATGRLWVARMVIDGPAGYHLVVRRQAKSDWEYLPMWSGPLPDAPRRLFLAVGAEAVVAFQARPTEAPWVLRGKGASWEVLAAPGRAGALQPSGVGALALDDTGAPVVAFSNSATGEVEVMRYQDGWSSLAGGGSVSASDAPSLDPAMGVSGDALCVGWAEPALGVSRVVLRCHRR